MKHGMSVEEDIRTFLGSVRIHDAQACTATTISKNMFLCTDYCTRYIRDDDGDNYRGIHVHPIDDCARGLHGYPVIHTFFFLRKEEMLYAPSRELRAPLACGTLLLAQPYPLKLPPCL